MTISEKINKIQNSLSKEELGFLHDTAYEWFLDDINKIIELKSSQNKILRNKEESIYEGVKKVLQH